MRLDKQPLDFTPQKDDVFNHIKQQYVDAIVPMIGRFDYFYVIGRKTKLYNEIKKKCEYGYLYPAEFAVLCLDYIESCLNIEDTLKAISVVYYEYPLFVSCPYRPHSATWSHNHWHEIDPERLEWLFKEVGYEIVQKKTIKIKHRKYGIRPFLRWILGGYRLNIYELKLVE